MPIGNPVTDLKEEMMRELNETELAGVAGAGFLADFRDAVSDPGFSSDVGQFLIDVYEGMVDATSHVIGRVAGDLHPSYYR